MWEFTITILLKRFLNETAESVSESIAPNPLNYADFIATVFPISFEREKEPVTIAAEIRDDGYRSFIHPFYSRQRQKKSMQVHVTHPHCVLLCPISRDFGTREGCWGHSHIFSFHGVHDVVTSESPRRSIVWQTNGSFLNSVVFDCDSVGLALFHKIRQNLVSQPRGGVDPVPELRSKV